MSRTPSPLPSDSDIPDSAKMVLDSPQMSEESAESNSTSPLDDGIWFLEKVRLGSNEPNDERKPPIKAKLVKEDENGEAQTEPLPPQRLYEAEAIEEEMALVDERSWPTWMFHQFCAITHWCFGLVGLVVILAVLACTPIIQFLSLGYLLESSGRIARSGRIRDGFIGIGKCAHVGGMVAGTYLMLLPVWHLYDTWYASNLIDESSRATVGLRIAMFVVAGLIIPHIIAAWFCGGRFRHFFWPVIAPFQLFSWTLRYAAASPAFRPVLDNTLGLVSPRLVQDICMSKPLTDWFVPAILIKALLEGKLYTNARDAVWDFVVGLRLQHYFWLGARGFAGAVAWLFVPILFMIGATVLSNGAAVLSGFIGYVLLSIVVLYLPFLQTHFAAENRMVAMFEVGRVRQYFRQAPIAFWIAFFITLLFAIPLYLLKIEATQEELTWIPALFFVLFIIPARLLTGWAVGRGRHWQKPRFFLFRWASRVSMLPVAMAYVTIVFVTQYTSWYGKWSLLEQHAFLVPVPFFSL